MRRRRFELLHHSGLLYRIDKNGIALLIGNQRMRLHYRSIRRSRHMWWHCGSKRTFVISTSLLHERERAEINLFYLHAIYLKYHTFLLLVIATTLGSQQRKEADTRQKHQQKCRL